MPMMICVPLSPTDEIHAFAASFLSDLETLVLGFTVRPATCLPGPRVCGSDVVLYVVLNWLDSSASPLPPFTHALPSPPF